MGDWLREYNLADVEPFIEALEKTRAQYFPDKIDMLKDTMSIPGFSMTYVINKALDLRKRYEPKLYAPGQPVYVPQISKMQNVKSVLKHEKNVRNPQKTKRTIYSKQE